MPSAGYWDPDQAAPLVGGRRNAGSTTCTTSDAIRPSCWWAGFACVVARVHAPPGRRPDRPLHRGGAWGGRVPHRTAGRVEGPHLPARARARAGDPQGGRQGPLPGNRDHSRSCGAGVPEAGVGAESRGGLPPVLLGFRPKRRAHDAVAEVRHLTSHSYEWIVEATSKPASMKSRIRPCLRGCGHASGTNASWPW